MHHLVKWETMLMQASKPVLVAFSILPMSSEENWAAHVPALCNNWLGILLAACLCWVSTFPGI
eukprot:8377389-Prorocentrum_lima.AAC.1